MSYSQSLLKKCRKYGLLIEELAYCTLVDTGYRETDAYLIAFKPPTTNHDTIRRYNNELKKKEHIITHFNLLRKENAHRGQEQLAMELKLRREIEYEISEKYRLLAQEGKVEEIGGIDSDEEDEVRERPVIKNRTKEDIIQELNAALETEKDPKIRLDYFKQLADLQQMKKEQDKEDDETIHYYFPITCDMCPHSPED